MGPYSLETPWSASGEELREEEKGGGKGEGKGGRLGQPSRGCQL